MATLRTRLTVAYGAALTGGLIIFAIALYVVRVASSVDALGPTAIGQADRVMQPLRAWVLNGHPLVEEQPSLDPSEQTIRSLTGTSELAEELGRIDPPGRVVR